MLDVENPIKIKRLKRRHTRLKAFDITYTFINPTSGEKEEYWCCVYAKNELTAINVLLHTEIPVIHIGRIKRIKEREKQDHLLWRVKDQTEIHLWEFASRIKEEREQKENQKKSHETT